MIYENQLLSALNEQKRSRMRFGEILLKNGWISEQELVEGLSEQLNIPFVDLNTLTPDREVLDLVPRTLAEKLNILPIGKTCDNKLRVATAEPMDILVVDELRFYTGLDVEFVLATSTGLKFNLHRFYDALKMKVIQENNSARNALIGGILVNAGLITENQVQSALNE
jgi:type IV pilus assembly protein PilB